MITALLAGCAGQAPAQEEAEGQAVAPVEATEESSVEEKEEATTIIYAAESGDIEVPADPQRIVVLDSSAAGAILMFDGDVVGHEVWTGGNPLFADYLKDSTEVAVDNMEQVMALNPDLIITGSNNENIKELSEIAPTVSFTYGKNTYLDAIIEYGKLVNKEAVAREWVVQFQEKAQKAGASFKEKYGEDVSISVMEGYGDEIYLYGDNWGRGTQIVYQEMGLVMPEAVKEVALTDGYYSISAEVIPKYQADLMVFAYFNGSNLAFMETETWKNLDAVKNERVLKAQAESFYMTGPITLEYQLQELENFFLK